MESMIRKSAVLNRLKLIRTKTEMDHKMPATKRRAIFGCIDEVLEAVDEISMEGSNELVDTAPDPKLPEDLNEKKPEKPKVPKNQYLEPIMTGSLIGIERLRCGKCRTVVDKPDLYCRRCGSPLGDIVKHKSTKWDTERHRPAGKEAG